MTRVQMKTPLVEINGDEMTRVLWEMIKEKLILPYIDLKTEYYDLSLSNRDATDDRITTSCAEAIRRLGVGVKCATITANKQRMAEYSLKQMWSSPNATIRSILDGTVFRKPIIVKGIKPFVPAWKQPIIIARHAFGDMYKGVEWYTNEPGKAAMIYYSGESSHLIDICRLDGPGVLQSIYNTDASIYSFANACFQYALSERLSLWFSAKDTISKIYDHHFKDIFQTLYHERYEKDFALSGISYTYMLIDDAVAQAIRSCGGFVWALKNYDGDVISDLVASAYGSLAMMTSVLVSPDQKFEFEAAHGTVTRHYYRHLKGEETSTNPVATIFAWTGAIRKRGELDKTYDLCAFADNLERATLMTIEGGTMTGDIAVLYDGYPNQVSSAQFLQCVANAI